VQSSASDQNSTKLLVQYPITVVRSCACLIYCKVCQSKFRLLCQRLPSVHLVDPRQVIDLELTHGLWALVVQIFFSYRQPCGISLSKRVDCGSQACHCLLGFKSVQRTFGDHLFKITYSVGLGLDGPM
jgi:hypothetical protein